LGLYIALSLACLSIGGSSELCLSAPWRASYLRELLLLSDLPELFELLELLLLPFEDELLRPGLLLRLCDLTADDEDRPELEDLLATECLDGCDLLTVARDLCVDDCDLLIVACEFRDEGCDLLTEG
jgi:hypothetical protein